MARKCQTVLLNFLQELGKYEASLGPLSNKKDGMSTVENENLLRGMKDINISCKKWVEEYFWWLTTL